MRFSNSAENRCIDSCSAIGEVVITASINGDLFKCAGVCPAVDGTYYYKTVSH